MQKVRQQFPALAALVDFWWHGVGQDIEPLVLSPLWRQWVQECLLPLVYWGHQIAHTRCMRRKAKMLQALQAVRTALNTPALTKQRAPRGLADWPAWARHRVSAFQRASSAVEGRNGALAQWHHHQRGLPKRRHKVWTVL
jgi:hypothetical protein